MLKFVGHPVGTYWLLIQLEVAVTISMMTVPCPDPTVGTLVYVSPKTFFCTDVHSSPEGPSPGDVYTEPSGLSRLQITILSSELTSFLHISLLLYIVISPCTYIPDKPVELRERLLLGQLQDRDPISYECSHGSP
jgi:hypothetical protein